MRWYQTTSQVSRTRINPFEAIKLLPLVADMGFEPMTYRLWACRASSAPIRDNKLYGHGSLTCTNFSRYSTLQLLRSVFYYINYSVLTRESLSVLLTSSRDLLPRIRWICHNGLPTMKLYFTSFPKSMELLGLFILGCVYSNACQLRQPLLMWTWLSTEVSFSMADFDTNCPVFVVIRLRWIYPFTWGRHLYWRRLLLLGRPLTLLFYVVRASYLDDLPHFSTLTLSALVDTAPVAGAVFSKVGIEPTYQPRALRHTGNRRIQFPKVWSANTYRHSLMNKVV